jgi:hypothetical protein
MSAGTFGQDHAGVLVEGLVLLLEGVLFAGGELVVDVEGVDGVGGVGGVGVGCGVVLEVVGDGGWRVLSELRQRRWVVDPRRGWTGVRSTWSPAAPTHPSG